MAAIRIKTVNLLSCRNGSKTKKLAEKARLKYPDRVRRKIDPMNSEYLAEAVRIDILPNSKFGIAVDLKMTVNMVLKLQARISRLRGLVPKYRP